MKILITGVNGFVGKHLARELKARGCEVVGVGRNNALDASLQDLVSEFYDCDLTDTKQVKTLPLEGIDGIISLAGLAKVGDSFDNPEIYKKVNVEILELLCQRLLDEELPVRVVAISTGAVYEVRQSLPLSEESALITSGSPYAQSKILMEEKAREFRAKGLDCVIVRPFNHIGPGQEPGFFVPDYYQRIRLALSTHQPLRVGDLETRRDYTDVRDVVRAYADLIMAPKLMYDTYNVCTGRSIPGREMLDLLLEACGALGKLEVEADQSLIRPDDPRDLYGSPSRLNRETGWAPRIKVEQTIRDFVQASSRAK